MKNNTCNGNDNYGIYIVISNPNNIVQNNTCNENALCGIYLSQMNYHNIVRDNYCNDSAYGIALYASAWNTIKGNTISGNTNYGINIGWASRYNQIYGNVLLNNNGALGTHDPAHAQAFDAEANFWNSSSQGNYWSDWTAPDMDVNGIVDQPYNVAGGSTKDHFPLTDLLPTITTTPGSPIYTNDHSIEVFVHMTSMAPMTTGNMSFYANGVLREHYALWGMDGTTSHGEYMLLYPDSGVNEYFFTVNDTAGNSRTIVLMVYRDISPPTVTILAPAGGSYNNTGSATLVWSGHDAVGIDRYEIFVNGDKVATVGASTTSYTLTLEEGHDEIEVHVYDLAGSSAHASITVTVDLTGPIVEIVSPSNGSYNTTGSVTVVWQGENPLSGIAHYLVSIDDGAPLTVAANVLEHTFDGLGDGSHNVVVRAVDNAGNNDSDSVAFTVDTTVPSIAMMSPTEESIALDSVISVTFSEEMNRSSVSMAVNGVALTNCTWDGNTLTASPTMVEGAEYNVTVSGVDLAGNAVTTSWSFNTTASTASNGGADNTPLIVVAIVAIAAIAAVGVLLMRKRPRAP